jgi:hypothetical protein
MTIYVRHGDTEHFMRPDRVYRTGVISPVAGFNPAEDVMSVAQGFTRGPYAFRQLGETPNIGLLNKIKIKIAAWRARKNARRFQALPAAQAALPVASVVVQQAALPVAGVVVQQTDLTPGSASQMAHEINAMPSQRAAMLALIAANQMPAAWGDNVMEVIANRWNSGRGNRGV